MAQLTETMTKEEKGRKHIAEFLSAMKFHDPHLQSTIKLMRNKLLQIQQRESSSASAAGAVLIKKPQTVQKVIFKFNGSKTVLHRRPQTLVSSNHETDSSNASKTLSSCKRDQKMIKNNNDDETLICKHQKINNNNDGDDQDSSIQFTNSRKVSNLENPRLNETMMNNNNEGTVNDDVMDFIKSVGGSEVELVIEKRLTKSDVNTNQGRLLIPMLQVKNRGFLTADEELILMGKKEDISVPVFDPERRKWTLKLTKWKMSKEYNYVFKTNWNHVVKANGLKGEMVIRVLSFRVDQQLCFALDRVA